MAANNTLFQHLSIVIPIRNMSGKLNNLFNEIKYLVAEDAQVILVNDGSSDNTSNEIVDYILKNKFQEKIFFVNTEFGGPGAARNLGKRKATRNWVCFWDADDTRNLDLMKNIIDLKSGIDLIVTDFKKVNNVEKPQITQHKVISSATHDLLINGGLWRVIFNSKFIENIDFLNLSIGEDLVFLAKVLDLSPKILKISQTTYFYHIGQKSQITNSKFINHNALFSLNKIFGQIEVHEIKRNKFIAVVVIKLIKTALRSQKWFGFKVLIEIVHRDSLQNLMQNFILIFYGLIFMFKCKVLEK